jgi:steroid delta-isomerase-like uncharacterized protein
MRSHVLLLASLLVAAAVGCTPSPTGQLEANKDLVRQFAEVTNAADWEALAAMVTEDLTRHSTATAGPPVTSREEFIQLQKSFQASFPNQRITVQQLVAEGDRVAILGTYSGTNTGPMGDIPATGKSIESPFLGIFRIESGKVAELWVEWDNLAFLAQLGLYPPPPSGE